jgi:nitric oxide reductase activation protein
VSVKKDNPRSFDPAAAAPQGGERRRIGRIVRDERDTASVEWVDAPADYGRVPLSIEGTLPPGVKRAHKGYNPYETTSSNKARATAPEKKPVKRDLRKLSEWIKQMRELEERKKRGDD